VVGFCDANGSEGVWDNYQCKHYESQLQTGSACEDAGKLIFHAYSGKFVPPRKYLFVAPRGPSTELRELLLNPSRFREKVLKSWDSRISGKIEAGVKHKLEGKLREYVEAFDFTVFSYASLPSILDDHRKTAYWASRFGGVLPAPPPAAPMPTIVAPHETVYVQRLLEVYSETVGTQLHTVAQLADHDLCQKDLQKQRERFYRAEAFAVHYRDQTEPGTVEDFQDQICDAVEPALSATAKGSIRLAAALGAAATASVASVLSPQAKVGVKQGVCHQLANVERLRWKLIDEGEG
jgi:hypothetical protein